MRPARAVRHAATMRPAMRAFQAAQVRPKLRKCNTMAAASITRSSRRIWISCRCGHRRVSRGSGANSAIHSATERNHRRSLAIASPISRLKSRGRMSCMGCLLFVVMRPSRRDVRGSVQPLATRSGRCGDKLQVRSAGLSRPHVRPGETVGQLKPPAPGSERRRPRGWRDYFASARARHVHALATISSAPSTPPGVVHLKASLR